MSDYDLRALQIETRPGEPPAWYHADDWRRELQEDAYWQGYREGRGDARAERRRARRGADMLLLRAVLVAFSLGAVLVTVWTEVAG